MPVVILFSLMLLAAVAPPIQSANILVLPISMSSHLISYGRLALGLSQHGHNVTYILPANLKLPAFLKQSDSLTIVEYDPQEEQPYFASEEYARIIGQLPFLSGLTYVQEFYKFVSAFHDKLDSSCTALHEDEDANNQLRLQKFDFAVMNIATSSCYKAFAYRYDAQVINFNVGFLYLKQRIPALPSFVPNCKGRFTDKMSFKDRMMNLFITFIDITLVGAHDDSYFLKYAPEKPPPSNEIIAGIGVFNLYQDLPELLYPLPTMPNALFIGDILIGKDSMPQDLDDLLNEATEGIILMAFGSYMDNLPPEFEQYFCDAFSHFPHTIIWKSRKMPQCSLSTNVKVMDWVPQVGILSHPKTKLFLSHCGKGSFIEASYYGVPMICVTFALDQHFHGSILENKGYGKHIETTTLTAAKLSDGMAEILTNQTIREKARNIAAILQDRYKEGNAAERASFWIHHLHKFGHEHVTTKAHELNIFQFLMFDIYLFVTFCFILGLLIIICMLRIFITYVYGKCKNKQKQD